MLLIEIKEQVMAQTNNDVDDLGDFMPFLMDYINEGYDRLVYAWAETHISDATNAEWPRLHEEYEKPKTPEWTHRALADWATWLVYRNGNLQKQQRGYPFRAAFEEVLAKVLAEGGKKGKVRNFYNIPI